VNPWAAGAAGGGGIAGILYAIFQFHPRLTIFFYWPF